MENTIIKVENVSKEYRLGAIGGTTLRDDLQRLGAKLRGKTAYEAAKIAADYVVEGILESQKDPSHTYGARFEPVLGKLIEMI